MAVYGGADVAFFLVDGYNPLADKIESMEETVEAKQQRTEGLGAATEEFTPVGTTMIQLVQSGALFDDSVGQTQALVENAQGTNKIGLWALNGGTYGQEAAGVAGISGTQTRKIVSLDGLTKMDVIWRLSGQHDEGFVLHTLKAEDSSPNTVNADVNFNNGGPSTNGAVLYVGVTALTLGGYTSIDFDLLDSADGVTYLPVTGAEITGVTTAPTAGRIAVTGTIRAYISLRWVFNGAGSSESVTFAAMCKRL